MLSLYFMSSIALAGPTVPAPQPNGTVALDGESVAVEWIDGDTFVVPSSGLKARLDGFNTLESYGPVHKFGPGPAALFGVANAATDLAKSQVWACNKQGGDGGYGRVGVDCPELRRAMLEQGLAHVFAVEGAATDTDLKAQNIGIAAKAGMWSEGAPEGVVTSAHSLDEKEGAAQTYNRVMQVSTGSAPKQMHSEVYKPCSWVCASGSCLLYVPYAMRYGEKKAECLQTDQ